MIRPVTCICLLMAAGSGLYLYQSKHQAHMLDREIVRTMKQADAARQRSGLLRAEYALLNDPARLADLAHTLLPNLQDTAPGQFTTFADLDRRLPAIGPPPAATPAPLEPQAPTVVLPKSDAVAAVAPPEPRPQGERLQGQRLQNDRPQNDRPQNDRREIAHADAPHVQPARAVAAAAPPRPAAVPARALSIFAAAPPLAVRSPSPRPAVTLASRAAEIAPRMAAAQPAPAQPAPVQPAAPVFASALGMARTMTTPVSAVYAAGPRGGGP
jgi:hypothetical protein